MNNPDKILTLPALENAINLVKECVALSCLGAISGIPGTGKTITLKAIEARYTSIGLPGNCFYYRCCSIIGTTRGLKDLLDAFGVRPGLIPSGATLQFTVRIVERELTTRQIRLLLLDEADSWDTASLQGLITLYDSCLSHNQPVSFVFAGSAHLVKWISKHTSALSRTLRCEAMGNLPISLTLSVLSEWGPAFEKLAQGVNQKDPEALKTVKHIYQVTGGNLRRLHYFAKLTLLEEGEITFERVKIVIAKLHQEVA